MISLLSCLAAVQGFDDHFSLLQRHAEFVKNADPTANVEAAASNTTAAQLFKRFDSDENHALDHKEKEGTGEALFCRGTGDLHILHSFRGGLINVHPQAWGWVAKSEDGKFQMQAWNVLYVGSSTAVTNLATRFEDGTTVNVLRRWVQPENVREDETVPWENNYAIFGDGWQVAYQVNGKERLITTEDMPIIVDGVAFTPLVGHIKASEFAFGGYRVYVDYQKDNRHVDYVMVGPGYQPLGYELFTPGNATMIKDFGVCGGRVDQVDPSEVLLSRDESVRICKQNRILLSKNGRTMENWCNDHPPKAPPAPTTEEVCADSGIDLSFARTACQCIGDDPAEWDSCVYDTCAGSSPFQFIDTVVKMDAAVNHKTHPCTGEVCSLDVVDAGGNEIDIVISTTATVGQVKNIIAEQLDIKPDAQVLIYPGCAASACKGVLTDDRAIVADIGISCDASLVLLAPASSCPDSLPILTLHEPSGDLVNQPMVFPNAGTIRGQTVNVKLTALSGYTPNNVKMNKVKGGIGVINLAVDNAVSAEFEIAIENQGGQPVQVDSLALSLYDLDEAAYGSARSTVSSCGAILSAGTELAASEVHGCPAASSTTWGKGSNNPQSVDSLTSDQLKRSATFVYQAVSSVTFKTDITKTKKGGRNTLWSLRASVGCP
jgi:hypothetical protein